MMKKFWENCKDVMGLISDFVVAAALVLVGFIAGVIGILVCIILAPFAIVATFFMWVFSNCRRRTNNGI